MSPDESTKQNNAPDDNKPTEKLSFAWIVLGIGAVLLMWVISSWLFR